MSRKRPRSPALAAVVVAVAGVTVLVLGAASHGFEPSLAGAPAATRPPIGPTVTAPATPSRRRLRASVVRLLAGADGSVAVVVRIANADGRHAVADALIVTELIDGAGGVVGASTARGTDALRVHVPYLGPGQSVLFVSDTIPTGAAPSHARVSATGTPSAPRPSRLEVRAAGLRHGVFGWFARAMLSASATGTPRRVLVEAVVRRGSRIVAAGTTIAPVPPRGRARTIEIPLIGDARGGKPRVWTAVP